MTKEEAQSKVNELKAAIYDNLALMEQHQMEVQKLAESNKKVTEELRVAAEALKQVSVL